MDSITPNHGKYQEATMWTEVSNSSLPYPHHHEIILHPEEKHGKGIQT